MISAFVVDDSPTAARVVSRALEREGDIKVVGIANDPASALSLIELHNPDVVTLDVVMPNKNGLEVLAEIMDEQPRPVIMVSSVTEHGNGVALEALARGAVDCVVKPSNKEELDRFEFSLRAAVRVTQLNPSKVCENRPTGFDTSTVSRPILIAIAASTGGVKSLDTILSKLPTSSPPIVVTQHMRERMLYSLANRLNDQHHFDVKLATEGEILGNGMVRIAPPNTHLTLTGSAHKIQCSLVEASQDDRFVPGADPMMLATAEIVGRNAIGIMLSGMSSDGAAGMLEMKNKGSVCFGENEESCVVYGMPKAAAELGALDAELTALEIGDAMAAILAG